MEDKIFILKMVYHMERCRFNNGNNMVDSWSTDSRHRQVPQ